MKLPTTEPFKKLQTIATNDALSSQQRRYALEKMVDLSCVPSNAGVTLNLMELPRDNDLVTELFAKQTDTWDSWFGIAKMITDNQAIREIVLERLAKHATSPTDWGWVKQWATEGSALYKEALRHGTIEH